MSSLQFLHAVEEKAWPVIQQKYYGINRQEVAFIFMLFKNWAPKVS